MKIGTTAGAITLGLLALAPGLLTQVVAPSLPLQAISGGEVLLEVSVGSSGEIAGITVLHDTPPFTEALRQAVMAWRFRPDAAGVLPAAKVLVAAVFRRPTLLDVVPPSSPPADLRASPGVPVPIQWERPPYPPNARGNGVVILEVSVGPDGSVGRIRTIGGTPPFTTAAVDAALRWTFRPAVSGGAPVATTAYLVFGFREPVTAPTPRVVR